jgi:hypothetical protein
VRVHRPIDSEFLGLDAGKMYGLLCVKIVLGIKKLVEFAV